jgi:hypothetical protein
MGGGQGRAKDEGYLAGLVRVHTERSGRNVFLWGQILQQLYSWAGRVTLEILFWGAITTCPEGEKSAERNVPSGWLARSRFDRRSVIYRANGTASGFFCELWNNRIDSSVLMW